MSVSLEEVTAELAYRYLHVVNEYCKHRHNDNSFLNIERKTSIDNIRWMCQTIIDNSNTYPIDKLSRWLGFVQGVLATKGLIKVDEERDFSRPLFHAAYKQKDISIPPTREMKNQ